MGGALPQARLFLPFAWGRKPSRGHVSLGRQPSRAHAIDSSQLGTPLLSLTHSLQLGNLAPTLSLGAFHCHSTVPNTTTLILSEAEGAFRMIHLGSPQKLQVVLNP